MTEMNINRFLELARDQGSRVADGVRLPTERDLAELSGLSRGSVREYLAALKSLGLVDKTQGSGNVLRDKTRADGLALSLLVSAGQITRRNLEEARELYEVGMIPFIVERVTADDLDHLEGIARTMIAASTGADFAAAFEADLAFHAALFDILNNPIISQSVTELQPPLRESMLRRRDAAVSAEVAAGVPLSELRVDRIHLELTESFRRRDVDDATTVMRKHFNQWRDIVRNP